MQCQTDELNGFYKMNSPISSILLVGATGATGQAIAKQALAAGIAVRALVRKPDQLPVSFAQNIRNVEVVKGDVTDLTSLVHAMQGVDAVVSSLGTPLILKEVRLLSEGTTNLLKAIEQTKVKRFLCITGMGAGDSVGHGGFFYDRIILPLLLGRIYADKNRQEALIRASHLDWVIVRPAFLTNTPSTERYREISQFKNETMGKMSRSDVAYFMVKELQTQRYHQQSVNLTY